MGAIIFWGIIRTALLIPSLWLLYGVMEYHYWWWLGILSIYGIIIHPATIQYKLWLQENEEIIENTLCSSCKYFEPSAVICLLHDQHPSLKCLPCEGIDWTPKETSNEETEIHT